MPAKSQTELWQLALELDRNSGDRQLSAILYIPVPDTVLFGFYRTDFYRDPAISVAAQENLVPNVTV